MKLKEIGEYYIGLTYKPEDVANEGTIVLRSGNIQEGQLCLDDIVRVSKKIPPRLIVQPGDILMCSRNGSAKLVGKSAVLPHIKENMTFGAFMTLFRTPYNNYLQYFFLSNAFRRQLATGKTTTINQITINMLDNIDIELPESSILQKRCERLNIIKDIISKRKQQLQALDTLIKARFVEMFGDLRSNPKGWPVYRFEEITEIITDGEHATPRRVNQGIYLLSARNVLDHSLQLTDVDFIDQDEYDRIAKRIIPKAGDVLISCSGSVGRCCTVPEGLKFQMVRSTALLRFDKRVMPVYAEYMITSDDLQDQINSSKTASSQANLFQGKIAKLKGFLPPMELQKQFAAFVTQVDKSKSVIQQALTKDQLLFDSLMQKYFG